MIRFLRTLFIISLALVLFPKTLLAFSLPKKEIKIGDPVYVEEIDPLKYYAVFLPFSEPTNGQVCAGMSGEELVENNNLKDYGTCFINDPGDFTIVEIVEPFSSSYKDLEEKGLILQKEIIAVRDQLLGDVSEVLESEESSESQDGSEILEADSGGIITDLNNFIQDAQNEIDRILASLVDTPESSEATSSESVLGAKTFNILELIKSHYLVLIILIQIFVSLILLTFLIKELKRGPKNKE